MSTTTATASRGSHISRILVIARHAFTQLVRMKVFYFLAVFAVIAIASNFFDLPQHEGPESVGRERAALDQELVAGNDDLVLGGAVHRGDRAAAAEGRGGPDALHDSGEACAAHRLSGGKTARRAAAGLRLARADGRADDRGLANPLRDGVGTTTRDGAGAGMAEGGDRLAAPETAANGPTWSLQGAVFAVFLRASVMASLALLISTFSSSTLFTTIISFLIYFIGHFQADMRDAYLQAGQAGEGLFARMLSLVISLFLPDFQNFNVIDAVIEGQTMPLLILGKLTLIGLYYALFFTIASWFVFAEKEF